MLENLQRQYSGEDADYAPMTEVLAILGLAMYCLGRLHERKHPVTLMEYGETLADNISSRQEAEPPQ